MSLAERIHCAHDRVKHLGRCTEAGRFAVKARHGVAVLDLRFPGLPDDIESHVDLDAAAAVQDVRRAHGAGGVATTDGPTRGCRS
ncbi:hypothetical protein [Kitasatospora sp. NPDC050463]|uniref:hypothetical protein n=1 Tax=Kitasatospora sp. NPDC050463 TaxID=3155786 RepID=UPI0033F715A2